ncbi:MAG: hypothetical protein Q8920_11930 [Bacillota bacterium]|nr:hypothetical protein [Bacillota bacterium]
MSDNIVLHKQLINARILKNYGSWMYCNKCNSVIGYLCYTTYEYFMFSFTCNCGEHGSIELGSKESLGINASHTLLLKNGRLCCPFDQSPLFSIVGRNLKEYDYKVVCKKCINSFEEKIES